MASQRSDVLTMEALAVAARNGLPPGSSGIWLQESGAGDWQSTSGEATELKSQETRADRSFIPGLATLRTGLGS